MTRGPSSRVRFSRPSRIVYGYLSLCGARDVLGWRQSLVEALDVARPFACSSVQLVRAPQAQISIFRAVEAARTRATPLAARGAAPVPFDRSAVEISLALPPCAWPGRWFVEPDPSGWQYLIGYSGSPRREVRVGREIHLREDGASWPECPADAGCRVVGMVGVGPDGAATAARRAQLLALSFLVMET